MAAARSPKSIAVDTNVLIDLVAREAEVESALAAIRKRLPDISIVINPTVVQELGWLVENRDDEETRNLAATAARDLRARWSIIPINCNPAWHGVIELAAQELRKSGLIPIDEIKDSLIIAESSLAECALLMSSDRHMWRSDINAVNQILVGRHMNAIVITAPWKIAKDYAQA